MTTVTSEQLAHILEEKLEQKLTPLNVTITELKKTLDEAMDHVKFVNAKYDEIQKKLKTYDDERKALQNENKILRAAVQSMDNSISAMMKTNNELEQYTRRECVEIRGIPVPAVPSEEQSNNIVKEIGKLIGVEIAESDISVSHRMPPGRSYKGKKTGPPHIIVKFTRRDVKDNFYRARTKLKDKTTQDLGYSVKNNIYLAESLTEKNRELFKDCLQKKKDMKFNFIWTSNGKIFMRKDNDNPVIHIKNKDDLGKMQPS